MFVAAALRDTAAETVPVAAAEVGSRAVFGVFEFECWWVVAEEEDASLSAASLLVLRLVPGVSILESGSPSASESDNEAQQVQSITSNTFVCYHWFGFGHDRWRCALALVPAHDRAPYPVLDHVPVHGLDLYLDHDLWHLCLDQECIGRLLLGRAGDLC